jgi:hypothetical protein
MQPEYFRGRPGRVFRLTLTGTAPPLPATPATARPAFAVDRYQNPCVQGHFKHSEQFTDDLFTFAGHSGQKMVNFSERSFRTRGHFEHYWQFCSPPRQIRKVSADRQVSVTPRRSDRSRSSASQAGVPLTNI